MKSRWTPVFDQFFSYTSCGIRRGSSFLFLQPSCPLVLLICFYLLVLVLLPLLVHPKHERIVRKQSLEFKELRSNSSETHFLSLSNSPLLIQNFQTLFLPWHINQTQKDQVTNRKFKHRRFGWFNILKT